MIIPHIGSFNGQYANSARSVKRMNECSSEYTLALKKLTKSCWFGYRDVTIDQRLRIFVNRFSREDVYYNKSYRGKRVYYPYYNGCLDPVFYLKDKILKSFMRTAVAADFCSIPYDYFATAYFKYTQDANWKCRANIIQSASLKVVTAIIDYWNKHMVSTLEVTNDPRYLIANDCEYRSDYDKYLITSLSRKEHPENLLATLAYKKLQIDERWIVDKLGQNMLTKTRKAWAVYDNG